MINFRKTYRILVGVTLFSSSYGMFEPNSQDESIVSPPDQLVLLDPKYYTNDIGLYHCIVKYASKNRITKAGIFKLCCRGYGYPFLFLNETDMVHLSNHPGGALHTVENGRVAVGYSFFLKESVLKKHPAIWIQKSDSQYNPLLLEVKVIYDQLLSEAEGQYNCIDQTGIWVGGKHKVENFEHATVICVDTREVYDLGPGKILKMTWDGTIFCGIKVVSGKRYACLWAREKDNHFREILIHESEGLDENTLSLDLKNGDLVTYKKRYKTYKWSKSEGVVEFVD